MSALGLTAALGAQAGSASIAPARSGVVPLAGTAIVAVAADVPPPPRAGLDAVAPKQTPRLQFTPGAAPDLPPGPPTDLADGATPQGGSLLVLDNWPVTPARTNRSQTAEPTTVCHRDTAFYTGNWFAALSISGGRFWERINPYTAFPASDAGFCCDQYALYVPGDDATCMVIWLLQYGFSASTQTGRHRIAVAVGRDNLRRGVFHYYDLTPQAVGFPAQCWYDFPHLAHTDAWLYVASNVFDVNSTFQGTSMIRLSLNDLRAAAGAAFGSVRTVATEPGSHRLAEGAPTTMFWGTHTTSIFGAPLLRVTAWDDGASNPTVRDCAVSAWYSGTSSAPGPDNRDWLGGDDHRILGAYFSNGVVAFLWGSNAGGGFPRPFVRIAGFNVAQGFNRTLEASVWHSTLAWAFPSVCVNARGDQGGTICFGGGTSNPGTAAFVVDAQAGWAPLTNTAIASGAQGPATNRWGDYLATARHPQYGGTYVGAGYSIDAQGAGEPRFAWFGRQGDFAPFVRLDVTTTPVAGVQVNVDVPDRNGNFGGLTNFTRVYTGVQGMTWTAPAQAVIAGVTYDFERWIFQGFPQPVGQVSLTIADLRSVPTTSAEARYVPRRTLSIESNVVAGAQFACTPSDLNGNSGGVTPAQLDFADGTALRVVAAPTFGATGQFDRWLVDGVPQPPGRLDWNGTVRANHRLIAIYLFCGGFTPYGSTCVTASGRHVASTPRASCGPWFGDAVTYGVEGCPFQAAAVLCLGASRTTWNGTPLPLQVPNQPTCFVRTDMLVALPFATDGIGSGAVSGLVLPNNPGLLNASLFSQCVVVSAVGTHTFTNGVATLIGGYP